MKVIQKSSNGVGLGVISDWGMVRDRTEHRPNYP